MAADATNATHEHAAVMADLDREFDGQPTPQAPPEPQKEAAAPSDPSGPPPDGLEDKPPAEAAAPGPPPAQTEDKTEAIPGPNYRDWITKHKDPEKGAAHYWEITRQNAELQRRLEQYEASQPAPPAEDQPAEVPPQVAQLDTEMRGIEARAVSLREAALGHKTEIAKYARAIGQQDQIIQELNAEWLQGADPEREGQIRREMTQAQRTKAQYEHNRRQYESALVRLDNEAQALTYRYTGLNQSRDLTTKILALEQSRQAEERERYEATYRAEVNREGDDYNTHLRELAKEVGVTDKQIKRFERFVKGQLVMELNALEASGNYDGLPDVKAAMRERALDWKAMHEDEFSARQANYASKKAEQMATPGPTGKAAVAGSTPGRKPTAMEDYDSIEL